MTTRTTRLVDAATLRRIAAHLEENERRWSRDQPRKALANEDAWLLIHFLESEVHRMEYEAGTGATA